MNPAMAAQYRLQQQQQVAQQRAQHSTPGRRGVGPMVPGPQEQTYPTQNARQQQIMTREAELSARVETLARNRARRPTDRNMPDGIEELVVGNGVQEYKRLREAERKMDAVMMRKRLELQEQRQRAAPRTRKMRIWISNTAENQPWQGKELDENAFDFSSGSEATYKVQIVGRLLDNEEAGHDVDANKGANGSSDRMEIEQDGDKDAPKKATGPSLPKQRLSHFFKSIAIELDRAKALQQDASNVIEWKKPPVPPNVPTPPPNADFDSIQFERKSDENINCTVNLYRDEHPERFAMTKELSEVVDGEDTTREQVINALWLYIKAHGLQRDEEKRLAQCDDKLRAIFKHDTVYFPQMNEAITAHLLPLPPVKLPYTIRVDADYQANPAPTVYDILVPAEDSLQEEMLSIVQRNPEHMQTLGDISRLDNEIALIVQNLNHAKARHSFFTSMSKDPATFVKRWVSSQKRDMEIILGDSRVGTGNEWMGDEFRRGGKDGVWGSENVKESVSLLVSKPGTWGSFFAILKKDDNIMSSLSHHLLARCVDEFTQRVRNIQNGPEVITITPAGYALLALTTLFFFLCSAAIRYTYAEVVAALAMIESPTSTAIIRTPPEDADDVNASLIAGDEKGSAKHELFVIKSKPLTSKFRTITKHLTQRAGRLSRFRGLPIFLGYNVLFHLLSWVLFSIFPRSLLFRSFIHVLVSVGLCRISLLWNHVVISEPSKQSWYSRIVGRDVGRQIIVPTALFAFSEQAAVLVPATISKCFHLRDFYRNPDYALAQMSNAQQSWTLVKLALVGISGFVCFVFVFLPTAVAFTRVQASLLPLEEESIVPFDRTFGGRVTPAFVGGSGRLTMSEAWKSMDCNARVRVFKVYAKVALIQSALVFLYAIVILIEARFVIGPEKFDKMVAALAQPIQN